VLGVKSPNVSADDCVAGLGVAGFVGERRSELDCVVRIVSAANAEFELGVASCSASLSSVSQEQQSVVSAYQKHCKATGASEMVCDRDHPFFRRPYFVARRVEMSEIAFVAFEQYPLIAGPG
jgi:hypothetical protein